MISAPALTVSVDGSLGWALLAAAPVAAVAAAWWTWRLLELRDRRARTAISGLRGLFVLLALVLLADPAITRTVERLPLLEVKWSGGSLLDLRDAPDGQTRRESLASTLERARSLGLDRRFEIVESAAKADRTPAATLVLSAACGAGDAGRAEGRVVAVSPPRDAAVPDLSVIAVELPALAASGAPVEAVATIRARGAAGREVVVTISDGARVSQSGSRAVETADETFNVALGVVFHSVGWRKVSVEVAGLTGEVSLADNRFERWIELESASRSVLLVEGAPSWEGKFVRRALEKDATLRVDYATAVSREAVVEVRTAEAVASAKNSGSKPEPSGAGPDSLKAVLGDEKRLMGYDAIILGALDAASLTEADSARIVRFVDARGGGLVVLGGNAYAGSVLSARGALAGLIPAEIPARSLGRSDGKAGEASAGTVLAPAVGFDGHPAFATIGDDPAAVLGRLQKLGNSYLRVGALAPGAEAIAVDAASSDRAPLVVAHRYGAGRVTLVAPADTWRLSVGATAELEDISAKFWSGLVGWTAAGARARDRVWAEPTAVATGEPARLVLEARGADWKPRDTVRIEAAAELETPGYAGTATGPIDLSFVADAAEPGRFVAVAALPEPGTWLVTVQLDGRETAVARVEVRAVGDAVVRPDPSVEADLAVELESRGGGVVRDGDADAVVSALGSPASTPVTETQRPGRGVWWAFLLPALFAGEALLRRRSGADAAADDRES